MRTRRSATSNSSFVFAASRRSFAWSQALASRTAAGAGLGAGAFARALQRESSTSRRLFQPPRSTATQSPTRMPPSSEIMRTVFWPIRIVYSKACEFVAMRPICWPATAPPMPRSAWLLPERLRPLTSPSVPPTTAPPVCARAFSCVVSVTAVMRPYCTLDCACASPPAAASASAAIPMK